MTINGSINAYGGTGSNGEHMQQCCPWRWSSVLVIVHLGEGGGGGAGGSIKLMANTIAGNGSIATVGGSGGIGYGSSRGGNGSVGIIRLEAWVFSFTGSSDPVYSSAYYPTFVRPANMPGLVISSIGGMNVPPKRQQASLIRLIFIFLTVHRVRTVVVAATNIPANTAVTVKALRQWAACQRLRNIERRTNASSSASVQINLPVGYPSQLIVSSSFTITASNGGHYLR